MTRFTLRCVGPRRRPPRSVPSLAGLTLLSVAIVAAATAAAAVVEPVGVYSNVAADRDGYPYGFELSLWTMGDGYLGVLTYNAGAEGYAYTTIVRDVVVDPATGAISFRARMSLREARDDAGFWGPTGEVVEFDGVIGELDVNGVFSVSEKPRGVPEFFGEHAVVLRRQNGAPGRYADYGAWLAAWEGRMGRRDVFGTDRPVERPPRSLHVGLVGGIARTVGDGARYFERGGTVFGIDALYTLASRYSVGAQVAIAHWRSDPLRVEPDVRPPGVELNSLDVPQSGYVLELSPTARVSTGNVHADRSVVFVQASAGLYYVHLESPYSMTWVEGARLKGSSGSIGNKGVYAGTAAGVGLSLRLSESSRFEVYPQYHWVFAGDEAMGFFGVAAHFRVEFLHD